MDLIKRKREEEEVNSPAAKRFHAADAILGILDDDSGADAGGRCEDLATVMRSLEREIALAASASSPPPLPPPPTAAAADLWYLLEASDDELGIPPAASEERPLGEEAEAAAAVAAMWFGDDEMGGFGYGYDDVLGFDSVRYEDGEGVDYDHFAPFDYGRDDVWAV
ncbi:uncharacterized protein LOC121972540 [Zingiber officinale]|uniref:Uncharacterized protein n=1 Tax=Zingiber officinale TaxID=94328 RepID=A0A8J5LDX2_ZINOF|nr:uncharacterized protein LOC121972540 [Zingiber officinale]KAG6514609.1 hypothetical protein ZIOFF_024977 [Zingiber officinale]